MRCNERVFQPSTVLRRRDHMVVNRDLIVGRNRARRVVHTFAQRQKRAPPEAGATRVTDLAARSGIWFRIWLTCCRQVFPRTLMRK